MITLIVKIMLVCAPTTRIWKEISSSLNKRTIRQIKDKFNSIKKDQNFQQRYPSIFEAAEIAYERFTGKKEIITREILLER